MRKHRTMPARWLQGNVPHVARVAQRKCWLIDNYFKEYKHLKIDEPHVASNVRYIAFAMRTNSFYITTCFLPNGNGERRTCTP